MSQAGCGHALVASSSDHPGPRWTPTSGLHHRRLWRGVTCFALLRKSFAMRVLLDKIVWSLQWVRCFLRAPKCTFWLAGRLKDAKRSWLPHRVTWLAWVGDGRRFAVWMLWLYQTDVWQTTMYCTGYPLVAKMKLNLANDSGPTDRQSINPLLVVSASKKNIFTIKKNIPTRAHEQQ